MESMTKTTKLTRGLIVTAVSALALTISACGGDTPGEETSPAVTVNPTEDAPVEEPTSAPTEAPTEATTPPSEPPTETAGPDTGAPDDLTAAAIQAIRTAEAEVGGIAYEIDDIDDDGVWDVEVWVGDRSIEVEVSGDGASVVRTEDDDSMDSDDRAALESAQVDIVEAIEIAIGEFGGVLDDAELDDENDRWVWEVSIQGVGDVDVDIQTGEIVGR